MHAAESRVQGYQRPPSRRSFPLAQKLSMRRVAQKNFAGTRMDHQLLKSGMLHISSMSLKRDTPSMTWCLTVTCLFFLSDELYLYILTERKPERVFLAIN